MSQNSEIDSEDDGYSFLYCEIDSEAYLDELDRIIWIGLDLRAEPEESEYDRVCCRCGESLSADGRCENRQCRRSINPSY